METTDFLSFSYEDALKELLVHAPLFLQLITACMKNKSFRAETSTKSIAIIVCAAIILNKDVPACLLYRKWYLESYILVMRQKW